MHYIRYLKTPRIHVEGVSVKLKAVITITTDLGETFYDDDVALAAALCAPDHDGDIFLRRTVQWTSGMRSLPIVIDLTRTEVEWPAKLHVEFKRNGNAYDRLDIFDSPEGTPGLISVWSEPLHPTLGEMGASRRVERRFMPLTQRPLKIYEDTGDSIARHLWDGSLALTAYIDRVVALDDPSSIETLERALVSATYKRLNVIELGCGCGVVGIAIAQTIPDCQILLTDLPEVDELVDQNMEAANTAMNSSIEFLALDWEAPLPREVQLRTFDIIIAAECIYNTESIPLLVNTLSALLDKSPKAIVLISTKVRHTSESMFFDLASKAGMIQSGTTSIPLPGQPGQGYGDSATQVDVYVFQGQRFR